MSCKTPGGSLARWPSHRQVVIINIIFFVTKTLRQVGFSPGGPGGLHARCARWLRQVSARWLPNGQSVKVQEGPRSPPDPLAWNHGPRGRGRDPLGQGPGPGPLGPGAWGPLGPSYRIHMESVTTYCQADYLLSGKLPTVRQTTYCQS